LFLLTREGRLELLFATPADRRAGGPAAVLCHPHPLHGGTMHTKVVHAVAKGLERAGVACMRFNFRGVGGSTGVHDHGRGEMDDARFVLDHLAHQLPDAELWMAGFSFGSWVALTVGAADERVRGLIAIAPPTDRYDFDFLVDCDKPVLFLHGDRDELVPLARTESLYARIRGPKALCVFSGADHLFHDHLRLVRNTVFAYALSWPPREGRVVIEPRQPAFEPGARA
jgi:alpha/beta superfamily hydrolase